MHDDSGSGSYGPPPVVDHNPFGTAPLDAPRGDEPEYPSIDHFADIASPQEFPSPAQFEHPLPQHSPGGNPSDDRGEDTGMSFESGAMAWISQATGWSPMEGSQAQSGEFKSLSAERKYALILRGVEWMMGLLAFSLTSAVSFKGFDKAYNQSSYGFVIATGVLIWLWTSCLIVLFRFHTELYPRLPVQLRQNSLRIECAMDFVFVVFTMSGAIASAVSINESICDDIAKQCFTLSDICNIHHNYGIGPSSCPVNHLASGSAFTFFLFFAFCVSLVLSLKAMVTAPKGPSYDSGLQSSLVSNDRLSPANRGVVDEMDI